MRRTERFPVEEQFPLAGMPDRLFLKVLKNALVIHTPATRPSSA